MRRVAVWAWIAFLGAGSARGQEWPTLRGDPERSGYVTAALPSGPYRRAWVRHFALDRLGAAMEPIVGEGRVYVATHRGSLYALDQETGQALWRFCAGGAFLHSPAYARGLVVAGSTDGNLYALEASTGKRRWSVDAGPGGFSASPTLAGGAVLIGSRGGDFLGVDLESGRILWRLPLGAPIRQTAAAAEGRVYVTAEDLRVRCLDAKSGRLVWTSRPLVGQTARDYYPVLVHSGGRLRVVVLTNSVVNVSTRMWRDTQRIFRSVGQEVGVSHDGRSKIQEFARRDDFRGTPELWEKEQAQVIQYQKDDPWARSFFVFDAARGTEEPISPVLGVSGNGGSPTPPVVLPDGRLLVFYRSVYGNWNLGYHVLVALGLLDLEKDRIEPFVHVHGKQPPWNTFWGTADESQNFVAAENAFLIVHQGTLSRFLRDSGQLSPIAGKRDSWGGFPNLPWARNEWHGPARGGAAVVGNRLYWISGSRVHAYMAGREGEPGEDVEIDPRQVPTVELPVAPGPTEASLRERLREAVTEAVSHRWAPLYVDPGVGWREFFFADSAETFEALARAYPHLGRDLQARVKEYLEGEWDGRAPFSPRARASLQDGERRERFLVPQEVLTWPGHLKAPHPFGGVAAAWLWAESLGEHARLDASWDRIKDAFEDFQKGGWRLDPEKGDLYANRYLASLLALARMAEKRGDPDTRRRAEAMAEETRKSLAAWWRRAADRASLRVFATIKEWDDVLLKGDGGLFFRLKEHNQKVALFYELTPEVARLLREAEPEAVEKVWQTFSALAATWPLVGEEHQVHTGENFVDPPDFARDAFRAMAWLTKASREDLARRVDLPFCRADLSFVAKAAIALDPR